MTTPTILLLSCYELGHQPLSLAWPLAALAAAGVEAAAVDLAVDPFPTDLAAGAQLVAFSVPMHTALRLGVDVAQRVRATNPHAHLCFFGLYAWLNRDYLLDSGLADSLLAGEMEFALVELAQALADGRTADAVAGITTRTRTAGPHLVRQTLLLPQRRTLPELSRYAHYVTSEGAKPAGYTETTRGCLHTCRHCPLTPVYQGRFFAVPAEIVLADIRQQVAAGSEHITFGDPDFLNGPGHALRIARLLHAEWPQLTFDFTAKVEHLLKYASLLPSLAEYGATFVVSAFESTSDEVLAKLDKGHTLGDMESALVLLRGAGLCPQPTWMPFTPWSSLDDYLHLLHWIRVQGLVAHVPAVQLSIRLLIPPDSALLDTNSSEAWLGPLDTANFGYSWVHPDKRMDELQRQVAALAEAADDDNPYAAFAQVEAAASALAGIAPPPPLHAAAGAVAPPRMSEHWFC